MLGGDGFGDTDRVRQGLGRQDYDQTVDFRCGQANFHGLEVIFGSGVPREVDGVAAVKIAGKYIVEVLQGLGTQGGRFQVPTADGIHGHDPETAGIGDNAQGPAGGPAHFPQGLGTVEKLGKGIDPDDAGAPECGTIGGIFSRQGPGMRS